MENNADVFLQTFTSLTPDYPLTPHDRETLESIAKNHLLDLTTNVPGYFTDDLRRKLSQMAAERLALQVKTPPYTFTFSLWQNVVEDYHRNGYWGLQRLSTPPPQKEKKPSQARVMFSYIWIFIQAGIMMKAVVLYFGLNAANDESSSNSLFLYLALAFSFLSMSFFAWRLYKKEQADPTEPTE